MKLHFKIVALIPALAAIFLVSCGNSPASTPPAPAKIIKIATTSLSKSPGVSHVQFKTINLVQNPNRPHTGTKWPNKVWEVQFSGSFVLPSICPSSGKCPNAPTFSTATVVIDPQNDNILATYEPALR